MYLSTRSLSTDLFVTAIYKRSVESDRVLKYICGKFLTFEVIRRVLHRVVGGLFREVAHEKGVSVFNSAGCICLLLSRICIKHFVN